MHETAQENNQMGNGQRLQQVITDDLFPQVAHISDVKQVIEEMKTTAQNITQEQVKGLILLEKLGSNKYLHGDKDPYKDIRKNIQEKWKMAVANPEYYLDTIEALIPKPPKPIIMTEKGAKR